MFDIGWSELLVVGLVALIVIGPRELPLLLRNIGQWVRRARQMAAEFQSGIEEIARETELKKIHEEIEKANRISFEEEAGKLVDADKAIEKTLSETAGDYLPPAPEGMLESTAEVKPAAQTLTPPKTQAKTPPKTQAKTQADSKTESENNGKSHG